MLSYYIGRGILLVGGIFVRRFDSGKQLKYTLPLLLCLAFLLAPWPLIGITPLHHHISHWTPTVCTTTNITESYSHGTHQHLIIDVQYQANNKTTHSSMKTCSWTSIHNFDRCQEFYQINMTFTCVYDPDDVFSVESLSDSTQWMLTKFALSVEIATVIPVLLAFVLGWQSIRAICAFGYFIGLLVTFPLIRAVYYKKYASIEVEEAPSDVVEEPSGNPDDDKVYSEWFLSFRSAWNLAIGKSQAKVHVSSKSPALTQLFPSSSANLSAASAASSSPNASEADDVIHPATELVQTEVPAEFSRFCSEESALEGEHLVWSGQPFAFHQVCLVEYLLHWLFLYIVACFMYYSFFTGLVLGVQTTQDALALTFSYTFALLLFLPGMAWELLEPWMLRSHYILTNKRLARITQIVGVNVPWRREIISVDSIKDHKGVFVRPRRWGFYDVQVQSTSSKGWFLLRDLYLQDMVRFKASLRELFHQKSDM